MSELSAAETSLRPSERMPALFVGHGSPMNAIEDNAFRREFQRIGRAIRAKHKPQLIVCISAHWLTEGWQATSAARPKTIHDFGGFPDELFAAQYPAPGFPEAAAEIARLKNPQLALDRGAWGFDHGAWSVALPMFPEADIPMIQLSMDYSRPPSEHFAMGERIRSLRDKGALVLASGNIVHNLRALRFGPQGEKPHDWALEFDHAIETRVAAGRLADLQDFQLLSSAKLAHPTHEHYLPLLHAAGAVHPKEAPLVFNAGFQAASISMRGYAWGL
jgi:4,5-DOPA dioxygenase extradiol